MATALAIHSNAQYMFGVQHHWGNALMTASCADIPDTQDAGVASYQDPLVSARLGTCSHSGSYAKSFSP